MEVVMKNTSLAFALFVAFLPSVLGAQQLSMRLTNQDVIDMVTDGLSDDVIIAKIRMAGLKEMLGFDTSVGGLKALQDAHVSASVMQVMINPVAPLATVSGGASPGAANPDLPPPEVGVYWRNDSDFVLIEGQTISQSKVGGKAGSFFTDGFRSLHWDAYLNGGTSKNRVRSRRPVFYLYVPDGASASDFSLISLNKKSDRREFQIGSFGGIAAGKIGVQRDKLIPVQDQRVAVRTYRVTLDSDLKPGEYAFFMGTGETAGTAGGRGGARSGGSASGRVYDFSIPD
jgi:hypothetical protein